MQGNFDSGWLEQQQCGLHSFFWTLWTEEVCSVLECWSKVRRKYIEEGFLKTTDQPTTYHRPLTNQPTDHRPTDQMHQPPINRPPTNKKFEDQKFYNKFKMDDR